MPLLGVAFLFTYWTLQEVDLFALHITTFKQIPKLQIRLPYHYFQDDNLFPDIILDIFNLGSSAINWDTQQF